MTESHKAPTALPLRVGVSACLLGQNVRYDGKHKHNDFLLQQLGPHVIWVPVCPEVEMGLGTPREPIRLEGTLHAPRLKTHNTRIDHTEAMLKWSQQRLDALEFETLSGYIFKSRSPSCGLFQIPVLQQDGSECSEGRGLFAQALTQRWPMLPVLEEASLQSRKALENFRNRMYEYHHRKTSS